MQPESTDKTENLAAFAWRLGLASDEAKLTQAEIAARLGAPPSRVGNWFQAANFPRRADARRLADLLGVSVDWLLEGTGEKNRNAVAEEPGTYVVREVPVISWSHAGTAATYEEMPKHFHGSVATTSRDRKAFAVTVEGDSMEPKFFTGDRVVLEPSHEPRNGKPVVAKFKEDESVQLRLYTKLPTGKVRLAPYNQIYPTIEHDQAEFAWIFPVRELVRSV